MLLKDNKRKGILYIIIALISLGAALKHLENLFIVIPFVLLSGVFVYRFISLGKKGEK